ncbi:HEAT repeat domain-containing protein [Halostagnicola sp. A-GB9-2]|uniref:HEAT repeat domain-containing protein n=1 Tax=Halostagnicola sp. A-GB9-2 TaxID=3048066 RepID=UPI0024C0A949|nr:HEAT repeat domain-containing protein [Halostagnicola sp. A-GB9-2]MDJ1434632.1 HEAT repeat domain-containing protein [Halostagnicola sp. A-GB9-2]
MEEEHVVGKPVSCDPDRTDIETLESMLRDERGQTRKNALDAVLRIGKSEPDRVTPLADTIVDRLDDSFLVAQITAADAVSTLATRQPDAVSHGRVQLLSLLDEDPPLLRSRAARAISHLVDADPVQFVEHSERFFDILRKGPTVETGTESLLTGDEPSLEEQKAARQLRRNRGQALSNDKQRSVYVRRVAAESLGSVAQVDPESCSRQVSDCVNLFKDEQARVRGEAVDVVRHVAEWNSGAVGEAIDPLTNRLDDEAEFVRARAIRALGFAEATQTVPQLEATAAAESADSVAELAATTAEWLENRA